MSKTDESDGGSAVSCDVSRESALDSALLKCGRCQWRSNAGRIVHEVENFEFVSNCTQRNYPGLKMSMRKHLKACHPDILVSGLPTWLRNRKRGPRPRLMLRSGAMDRSTYNRMSRTIQRRRLRVKNKLDGFRQNGMSDLASSYEEKHPRPVFRDETPWLTLLGLQRGGPRFEALFKDTAFYHDKLERSVKAIRKMLLVLHPDKLQQFRDRIPQGVYEGLCQASVALNALTALKQSGAAVLTLPPALARLRVIISIANQSLAEFPGKLQRWRHRRRVVVNKMFADRLSVLMDQYEVAKKRADAEMALLNADAVVVNNSDDHDSDSSMDGVDGARVDYDAMFAEVADLN